MPLEIAANELVNVSTIRVTCTFRVVGHMKNALLQRVQTIICGACSPSRVFRIFPMKLPHIKTETNVGAEQVFKFGDEGLF